MIIVKFALVLKNINVYNVKYLTIYSRTNVIKKNKNRHVRYNITDMKAQKKLNASNANFKTAKPVMHLNVRTV